MWDLWVEKFIPSNEKDPDEAGITDTQGLLSTQVTGKAVGELSPDDIGSDDLGVADESKMSPDELRKSFGMQDEGWFGFNTYQHAGTINPWDDKDEWNALTENAEENVNTKVLSRFTMKWHQLVGVKALVRLTLSADATQEERDKKGFVLLADGVGAGKTCQIIAFITLLKQLRVLTKQGAVRPPVFRKSQNFYAKNYVLSLSVSIQRRDRIRT